MKTNLFTFILVAFAAVLVAAASPVARGDEGDFDETVSGLLRQLDGEPAELFFYIAFYEGGDWAVVEEILPMLRERLQNIPVKLIDKEIPLPADAFVEIRKKYYAGRMMELLAENVPDNSLGLVAVTAEDIYIGRRPYVRGASNPELGTAIVSTSRLTQQASEYRYKTRVLKEILHEMGHLLGLEHCEDNSNCIMAFSLDLNRLDSNFGVFCPYHEKKIKEYLEGKGVDLEKYRLPDQGNPPETGGE